MRESIEWLGLAEIVWIGYWLLSAGDSAPGYLATVVIWIVAMLGWMILVSTLGKRGFFLKHTRWLSNLVGFSLVLAFAVLLFGGTEVAKAGLVLAASNTSNLQLILIHVLRLLAVGAIIKYVQGELPLHFVVCAAIPDLLFAVSAVVLTIVEMAAPLGKDFLIIWHLIGFVVFFGPGLSMFFSLPSPLRIYRDKPDTSIVFEFPMLLAPNFTVPLFALAHLFALVKLFTS